jgi:hypothetical protein
LSLVLHPLIVILSAAKDLVVDDPNYEQALGKYLGKPLHIWGVGMQ